jgi:hypothetical protein
MFAPILLVLSSLMMAGLMLTLVLALRFLRNKRILIVDDDLLSPAGCDGRATGLRRIPL